MFTLKAQFASGKLPRPVNAPSERTSDAVLAILREARDAGIHSLTRTVLMKLVYLLDTFVAEEADGAQRWTDLSWRFHYFGPYADALLETLSTLEARSFIDVKQPEETGKDFLLYSLADWKQARSLEQLGVPRDPRMRLAQAIREYAFSLPKLLNFVYFHTDPMEDALPGEQLDFSKCRKVRYKEDVRPLKGDQLSPQKVARARELLSALTKRHAEAIAKGTIGGEPVCDEELVRALSVGDSEPVDGRETVTAALNLSRRGS